MTKVNVIRGDITKIAASALITAINPEGMWFGGVDKAIYRSSGDMFHDQAGAVMPLRDGQIIFAPKTGDHSGEFDSVLFVVDSLVTPIYDLMLPVFKEADKLGLRNISVPAIRTGVMAGVCEPQIEAVEGLAQVIIDIVASNPVNLQEINVIIYDSQADLQQLQNRLKELSA